MNCKDAIKHCQPFLDKQLDAAVARDVDQHLAACPPCNKTYRSQESFQKLIKKTICESENGKAPDSLKTRILLTLKNTPARIEKASIEQLPVFAPARPQRVHSGVAVAASFFFGLSGLFTWQAACIHRQCPLVQAAQHEHDKIIAGSRAPLLRSDDVAELTRVASKHLQNFPGIPNLTDCNLKAETCGVIRIEGLPQGVFVEYATCACGSEPATLMVINTSPEDHMPGGEPVEKFIAATHANHHIISWRVQKAGQDGSLLYILVTKRPFEEAMQVAEVASR